MPASPPNPATRLRDAFHAAVRAADPEAALRPHWPPPARGRTLIVAVGKAAEAMARAAERHYAAVPLEGLVVVPAGTPQAPHAPPEGRLPRLHAGHPLPDDASFEAGERLLTLAAGAGPDDVLLVLLSGGASALACAPAGLSPEGARRLYDELLRSGADIAAVNTVRRAVSRFKGGRLAAAAHPAQCRALLVSDVVGDAPADIGSGPTAADPTGAEDALAVLSRYGLEAGEARAVLERAARGEAVPGAAPVRASDARLARASTTVVASAQRSLEAAAASLEARGIQAVILSDAIEGDARQAARFHAAVVRQVLRYGQPWPAPRAVLSGGEVTVRVRGRGRGGPNSTFALALALALPPGAPVWGLVADSDGVDGVGGQAGAFLDPGLLRRLPRAEAEARLADDDARAAFERAGTLFEPGPTGTNVNDLRLLWIGGGSEGASEP